MPAAATSISSADTSADGTRSVPAGPAMTSPRSSPGAASVPMIGTGRVCGTAAGIAPEADPLGDAEPARQLDHVGGERPPAVVGLGPDEDEEVALVEPGPAQDELGPGQLGEPPVDDLERRTARPVVEQQVGVERRDDVAVVGQDAPARWSPPSRRRPSRRTRRAGRAR